MTVVQAVIRSKVLMKKMTTAGFPTMIMKMMKERM
jgi:hypothetical protein